MAAEKKLLIAITPENPATNEAKLITAILDSGWDYVHLRHPSATLRDMRAIIEAIPQRFHNRLRLHGHFELLNEFNLGGIHLNSRCPEVPPRYNGSVSRTCHSIEETRRDDSVDFVTLSPVCDSISKSGYKGAFSDDALMSIPQGRVVALGGVSPDTVQHLKAFPFIGYAVLGYLFSATTPEDISSRCRTFIKEIM